MTTVYHRPVTVWEKVAETKWGRYISQIEEDAILKAHRTAGKPVQALEIGCEGGRWSELLTDLGWNMVCTDIDEAALAACQKRIPSAKCIRVLANDRTLPCTSSSMALILCLEVNPVIEADWFLNEARRTLSDGGMVIGTFNNLCSLRGLFVRVKRRFRPKPWFSYYQMSYGHWRRNALDHGFTMLYERGFCWFPFSRASQSPLIPTATMMERKLRLQHLVALSPWVVFIAQKKSGPVSNGEPVDTSSS